MTASSLSDVEERALRRIRAEGFSDEDLEAARELVRQPEALALRRPIPSIREFVESPHYLGAEGRLYPEVLEALEAINDGEHVECVLTGGTSTGKALALDTPIPTPNGWTTMGEVREGDEVYAGDGSICRVVRAHEIMVGRQCYRVSFSDGTSIVADEDHLWETCTRSERARRAIGKVRSTREIKDTLSSRHAVKVAPALEGRRVCGRIDPYVLGLWLGDGSKDSARLWTVDEEVVKEVERYYHTGRQARPNGVDAVTVHGISRALRHHDLLRNKHIPNCFLRAEPEDRLSLLQGLMESDGTIDKRQGRCEFLVVNERLARGVLELVRSLGIRASWGQGPARIYGKDCGTKYRVGFTPPGHLDVFRLRRKRKYQDAKPKGQRGLAWRSIWSVEPVESVPVRCITVDSSASLYLAGESMIPTHNTTIAVYSIAYQTWVVGCYEDPHALFGLDPASEIEFVFQSINLKLADEVGYERFRNLVRAAPCFRDYFRPDSKIQSKLKFPRNVVVKPVVGEVTGAMGQNVIGGVVDEMNFMEVVERSAKTQGERYDQATALYSTIARRREGRFLQRGGMLPGMLCLVSSANYRGAFIDRKVQEARENSRIYVWDKPQWGVTRPTERYSGETFRVFRGDDARRPRILTDDEAVGEGDEVLVLDAPVEHRASFESDLLGALRDVAGVPTDAVHPFIARPDAVAGVFGARPSIFSRESVDFEAEALKLYPGRIEDPDEPRAIHVDLGAVSDSAGVAIGYCPGFARIERGPGEFEVLPRARFDALLEVRVPRGGEIDFERIRSVIYRLADKGVRIGWVTFDSWQSRDSIQQLRRRGFRAGVLSMDRAPQGKKPGGIDHWMLARGALYDERVEAPDHEKCRRELLRLELDAVHRKIDHPPGGSSDVAQAFGAVIAKLHRARETWSRWRIPVTSGSPVGTHEDEVREGAPERPRPGGSTRPGRRRTR